jgi:hypothetical protein
LDQMSRTSPGAPSSAPSRRPMGIGSLRTIVRVGLSFSRGASPCQLGPAAAVMHVQTMAVLGVTSPTRNPMAR